MTVRRGKHRGRRAAVVGPTAAATASAPEQPVFVDPTGRRARRMHRLGRILVVPALAYLVALGSSLMGGPSLPSVLVPGQAQDAETASYVEFRDGVVLTPDEDEDAVAVPPADEASSAPDDGEVGIRTVSSEAESAATDPDAQRPESKRADAGSPGAKDRGRSKQAGGARQPAPAGDGASNPGGRGTEPKDKNKDKGSSATPPTPEPGANRGNASGE